MENPRVVKLTNDAFDLRRKSIAIAGNINKLPREERGKARQASQEAMDLSEKLMKEAREIQAKERTAETKKEA